tara:strand:+ start:134 stop:619 length:486 start_codon:yes stop_codon:yes gene_type:complete
MPDLYTRLSTEARPFEIAVGQMIEQNSSYQYIQDKTHMDYDVYLKHPDGGHLTVEVKVHAGASKKKKYDTACLEIKEYQYKWGRYVKSHWLKSDFKIMAHVDREDRMVHFYNGRLIRQWALDRKHLARYSTKVKTANITMPWKCEEAGYIYSMRLPDGIEE